MQPLIRTTVAVALALAVLLVLPAVPARGQGCSDCLRAGAASVPIPLPEGTPLAGYGSFARRLLFPDVFGRHPHAFWFKPAVGALDSLAVRALVLETPGKRLVWATVDLVAVDRRFTEEIARRAASAGLDPGTLIVSASHTHSGPGAFVDSAFFGLVALDRFDRAVREILASSVVEAIRRADAARAEARVGGARATAPAITRSRLERPVDLEVAVLKITTPAGAPIALVWNFAIHGTMLGPRNLRFSGDVMGVTSHELERALGVPALFVNGAVADVSPARHGAAALEETGAALAGAVRAAWAEARPQAAGVIVVRRGTFELPPPSLSVRNCVGRALPRLARWIPTTLTVSLRDALGREAELVAAGVGDTAWVTIPGELQTALGQAVRVQTGPPWKTVLLAGLSNDYLGYFVTAEDFARPTYVTCASLFGPTAGSCLAGGAADLLRSLGDGSPGDLRRTCTDRTTQAPPG